MTHAVSTSSETEATVTIEVPAQTLGKAVEDELRSLAHRVKLPGFRPGKVPQALLRKKYGAAVEAEIRQKLVEHEFREALAESRLRPLAPPALEPSQMEPKEDGAIRVELKLEVVPEFELRGYRDLQVTVPPVELSEADVDREIEGLRREQGTMEVVEGEGAKDGDYVVGDLQYQFLDGTSLPVLENRLIETATGNIDGVRSEAAIGKFLGAGPGSKVKITLRLPDEFPIEEHRGKTAVLDIAVKDVRRVTLPEVSAPPFLAAFEVDSVEALRRRVRERLAAQLDHRRAKLQEDLCVDQVLERHPFVLPATYLQRAIDSERERLRKHLTERSVAPAEIEKQLLEVDGRLRQQTERRLRAQILLDRIADAEQVEVTQEDIERHFYGMSLALQIPAQKLFDHMSESGALRTVLQELRRDKVRRFLREGRPDADEHRAEPDTQQSHTNPAEEA